MPKTVLITGASRGLGAAAAREAAKLGAQVVLHARSDAPLQALAGELASTSTPALAVAGDISLEQDRRSLIDQALQRFGRLDALVNNAGVLQPIAPLAESESAGWARNLRVNLEAPVMLIQACLPHLRAHSGIVVNVSSGAAVNPVPGWGAYCAAKAALNHVTRVLAAEEPQVTAVAFRPGMVDTAMQAVVRQEGPQGMTKEEHSRFVAAHRSGELLPPALPGRSLAALALFAPPELSGAFVNWDDPEVQALIPSGEGPP